MLSLKKLIILFIVLFTYSCSNKSGSKEAVKKENSGNFFQINYERLLKNGKSVYLSEIASGVEYIPLETNSECVIGNNPQYFFTDSLIFVNNKDHILKFTRGGKFLARIGTSGRGPQEIDYIRTMSVLPEKHLLVIQKNSESKILYFSFNGLFIRSAPIPRFYYLKVLTDGNYLSYESGTSGTEKYNFLLSTEEGDTLSGVYNKNTWTNNSTRSLEMSHPFKPFYISNNQIHFKSLYNDTVYSISSNNIVPNYYVDLGKYKLPSALTPPEKVFIDQSKMLLFFKKDAYKYFYCNVFESDGNVFLTTANFHDSDIRHFVYDKDKREGCMLINETKKPSGILNDWDGSIEFWPEGNFEKNKIYMPVDVMKIKEVLSEGQPGLKFNANKNAKLRELLSGLDDTGNPVIIIVTLKN